LLRPGKFTELFFLDEATAFAAGHRPCALCRREDYVRFGEIWSELHPGAVGADAIDRQLHAERLGDDVASRRLHRAPLDRLPDGVFVFESGAPWLVAGQDLLLWTPAGYADRLYRPTGVGAVITPPSLVEVLRVGWDPVVPLFHPSAGVERNAS